MWSRYFVTHGVEAVFFSAVEAQLDTTKGGESKGDAPDARPLLPASADAREELIERRARVLSRAELLAYFKECFGNRAAPARQPARKTSQGGAEEADADAQEEETAAEAEDAEDADGAGAEPARQGPLRPDGRITVGMVGYPNVGKSSTINVLCGDKKVSVSATPGHTKHFQTLLLDDLCLCDCPGLVFPSLLSSQAELVVSGILPIDQMRDQDGPLRVLCRRIPAAQFKLRYNLQLQTSVGDGPSGTHAVSPVELLEKHAIMRGFWKDHGRPEVSRSTRLILKDYINGRLLFCRPPPGLDADQRATFARATRLPADVTEKELARVAPAPSVGGAAAAARPSMGMAEAEVALTTGARARRLHGPRG